jgi:3',5'-nucleoside bisphosphate phosphatase
LVSGKLKEFYADLHIHTCLSPCADLEMSPRNIVKEAKKKGFQFIGICDHNSAENVPAVKKIGKREKIRVLGGMEVTSREEVHILALFDEDQKLQSLQEIIYKNLDGTNDERLYGEQLVVNEDDEVIDFNKKLLIGATEIPVYEVVDLIHQLDGLAIAAHIDREGFGIIGKLGFIPEDLSLDAVEIIDASQKDRISHGKDLPMIFSSDAHFLEDIGKSRTCFLMEQVTIEELKKSFRKEAGRRIIL